MKYMLKLKHILHSIRFIIALGIFSIFIWGVMLESNEAFYSQKDYFTVNDGWVQIIDGEEIPLESAQDAVAPDDDTPIVLERTISQDSDGRSLLFFSSHQEVRIYVDGELINSLSCPEEMEFYVSPGRRWMETPIHLDMLGKTLRIEFYSPFPMYHIVPSVLYYIYPNDIQTVQIDFMWLRNTVALCLVVLAVASYVNASIWKHKKLRRYTFSLADLYLFTGLWLCGEMNVLSIWTGNTALCSIFAMIFLRMIPIIYHQFVKSTMPSNPPWLKGLGVLAWSNFIGSAILQMFFGVSLVTTLPMTMAVFGVGCFIYVVGILLYHWNRCYSHPYDRIHTLVIIFPLASLIEVYCYLEVSGMDRFTGIFIAIASVIYSSIVHIFIINYEAQTQADKQKLENKQRAMERRPLYQEINAHFLYNTLNTISAYCKEDPMKADCAVNLLAQYMRGYMTLINTEEYVSFRDEINLIKYYVDILNLRYEDTITLEVDARVDDFLLPPLTLQPLIENAVSHGLHKFVTDGVIRISTRRNGNFVELIVSDNGKGFAADKDIRFKGVGLKNLTRRITAMGGFLNVDSKPNNGTKVIVSVPPPPRCKIMEGDVRNESNLCR